MRQEWVVALIIVALAAAFVAFVFVARHVDTDLGLTPTTTQPAP